MTEDSGLSERIALLETGMVEILQRLDSIQESITRAENGIITIQKEVQPTITALTQHPMVKMFLGKVK